MKTSQLFILVTFAACFAGCATVAPNELVNARSAYRIASEGPAQQLAPAELHKAHEALNLAEQSFQKEPDSYKTKDLAYVAQRKSEQAGALGSMAAATSSKDRANADFQTQQTEIMKQGKKDLSDSEKRTTAAEAEIDKQAALKAAKDKTDAESQRQQAEVAQAKKDLSDAELQRQQADILEGKQDLRDSEKRTADAEAEIDKQAALKAAKDKTDAESQRQQAEVAQAKKDLSDAELQGQQAEILEGKQDLRDSEKRTADALASLASLASLKEEERGLVLTLSGSIFFRSAEATLLPQAQVKLDQVAKALLGIPARDLIIEGHTDSQGSESYNQRLSQRRAAAIRDYLIQRGYPADHIKSRGRGEGSPIANNASAEGRANNRRVEIVIEREKQTSVK